MSEKKNIIVKHDSQTGQFSDNMTGGLSFDEVLKLTSKKPKKPKKKGEVPVTKKVKKK